MVCSSVVLRKLFAVIVLITCATKCVQCVPTTKYVASSATPAPVVTKPMTEVTDNHPEGPSSVPGSATSSSPYETTTTEPLAGGKDVCGKIDNATVAIKNLETVVEGLMEKNEGEPQIITCKMKSSGNKSCDEILVKFKNDTSLFMHHKNLDEDLIKHEPYDKATKTFMDGEEDTLYEVKFNFTVLHRHHEDHSIYCGATSEETNAKIISKPFKHFSTIEKLYKVSVSPKEVEVKPKEAFTLTCMVEDYEEVKDYIVWESQKAGNDYLPVKVTTSKDGGNASVLVVTKNKEWNGTYTCTTNKGTNPKRHYDKVSVLVKAPDKTAIQGTTIGLVVTAVLIILIVIALLIRRRALKKKIEISLMLMELQEAGANANAQEQTNLVGSVHSLSMEPAVNCYANAFNPDGSLAAETLAATFARFTSMYAPWQKERSKLVIKHILGEGNFGSVCLGVMPDVYLQGVSSQVAVKTIKPARMDKQAITEFEKEVSIMTTLTHENIVSLVGLCTETMPLYIIMEYMENGQLNDFLMGKAPNKLEETSLSTRDLLYMSLQPCKALEYLSNKNVVHRDISARNCLVGDKLSVKLADFGLSRGTAIDDGKNYYKKDGGMVPVKWMAPEALNFGKYTTANDVWSFGVLMWEIFSFGAIPYLSHSNQQVIVFVNRGGRLEKPDYCPQSIWEHVCSCWTKAPEDRITIGGLVNMLSTELDIIDTSSDSGVTTQDYNG